MKKKIFWKPLFMSILLFALMGTPLYAGGDDKPKLDDGDMSGIELIITPLTSTDVEIEQDVVFEVKIQNTDEDPKVSWVWFTVRFPAEIHDKIVSAPYLSKGSPFSGVIPGYSEAIFQLSVRPLNELQVGFYTLTGKVGPYIIPFDRDLVSASDSFSGFVLGIARNRGPVTNEDDWVLTSMRAVNETGRTFLQGIGSSAPRAASIIQNYPNPFNPSTSIMFEVNPSEGMSAPVELLVYDVRGRKIRTLVDEIKSPGVYTVKWDGRNEKGLNVESGVYLFKLESGKEVSIRKGVVTK
jgi:hypothetical protein